MILQINQSKLTDGVKKKITRIGVYGVAIDKGKVLVVKQKRGPYAEKFDFPGGGIEFGESTEFALRREFAEEVGMKFDSLQLIDNLTATIDVPKSSFNEPYLFYQIGMIYRVNGLSLINETSGELQHSWVDLLALSEQESSELLWKWRLMQLLAK
jgi:8-oxo-dGTP pyrophosphatase MutT (NUDIX family)